MASRPSLNFERRGQGEPIVLLHGIGGELCVWEPVLDALAERLDVIAVDLPGFGQSPPLPDGTAPTPRALAASVAAPDGRAGDRERPPRRQLARRLARARARQDRARPLGDRALPGGALERAARSRRAPRRAGRPAGRARRSPAAPAGSCGSRRSGGSRWRTWWPTPTACPAPRPRRMVSSYARATAYDATNVAMRQGHFTGADADTRAAHRRVRRARPADPAGAPARARRAHARAAGLRTHPDVGPPRPGERAAARDVRAAPRVLRGSPRKSGQWVRRVGLRMRVECVTGRRSPACLKPPGTWAEVWPSCA